MSQRGQNIYKGTNEWFKTFENNSVHTKNKNKLSIGDLTEPKEAATWLI